MVISINDYAGAQIALRRVKSRKRIRVVTSTTDENPPEDKNPSNDSNDVKREYSRVANVGSRLSEIA